MTQIKILFQGNTLYLFLRQEGVVIVHTFELSYCLLPIHHPTIYFHHEILSQILLLFIYSNYFV